jgi:hypothetical protein
MILSYNVAVGGVSAAAGELRGLAGWFRAGPSYDAEPATQVSSTVIVSGANATMSAR